jgi:hypothetical protein
MSGYGGRPDESKTMQTNETEAVPDNETFTVFATNDGDEAKNANLSTWEAGKSKKTKETSKTKYVKERERKQRKRKEKLIRKQHKEEQSRR